MSCNLINNLSEKVQDLDQQYKNSSDRINAILILYRSHRTSCVRCKIIHNIHQRFSHGGHLVSNCHESDHLEKLFNQEKDLCNRIFKKLNWRRALLQVILKSIA